MKFCLRNTRNVLWGLVFLLVAAEAAGLRCPFYCFLPVLLLVHSYLDDRWYRASAWRPRKLTRSL